LQTLWVCALALQELAGPAAETAETATDVISLVTRTGLIEQLVLALLVLDVFRRSSKFSEVQAVCRSLGESPLVGLFQAGYGELNTQLRGATGDKPATAGARPTLKSLEAVDRALLRASGTELAKLEDRVGFLATTASITPFIGLFGTVWGIMTAFQAIGAVGSSNLAVVAPGIAAALIATAAGLFAAIPAVYFYNHFTHKVRGFAAAMEDFSLEFLNISERNFT
jgi:biopolymer transport protein TolQ